jgi:flagellar protein FlaG
MASSVVSELVLFIVSLLVAGMVAGGLYVVTQDISGGVLTKGQDVAESLRTNFEIINDPENIPVSGSSYVFYIRNIGKDSFSFDPNSVVVMIDGSMIPPANLTFDPSGVLAPYEVGKIYVPTAFISSGYHKITVVIETGKRKSLVFEVG